jgi:two-component system, chemotaxis family, CheB/CheR fusion protein
VQELRSRDGEVDVELRDLVSAQLDAHAAVGVGSSKVAIEGPPVALSSTAAQTLGLAVHELATNALKYGALSKSSASLFITWEIRTLSEPVVRFTWKESGMELPPNTYPGRSGYGTELIRRVLPFDLGAKTDLLFEPDGLRCVIVNQGKLSNS